MSTLERSLSRGRTSDLQSTGRGGFGNYRSPSREYRASQDGPEDFSDTRGRDPIPSRDPFLVTSTGRGGSGNIRSPSRDAIRGGDDISFETSPVRSELRGRGYDRELIATIDNANDTGVYSYGRGGAGNKSSSRSRGRGYEHEVIAPLDSAKDTGVHAFGRGGVGNKSGSPPKSQSRSRSREPVHAAGRGGLGNIYQGGPSEKVIEELDESERVAHQRASELHSTGRGGTANLTSLKVPYLESAGNAHGANHPRTSHEHDAESFGRGGAGNISRDHSREPGHRNPYIAPSGVVQGVTG